MNTLTEIVRRLRFVWALAWIGVTALMLIYSPAAFLLRLLAPTAAWLGLYIPDASVKVRLAIAWVGVCATAGAALSAAQTRTESSDAFAFFFVLAPGGAVAILLAGFLIAPVFKR